MKLFLFSLLIALITNSAYGQVKATSSEINTGTDDDKFATALALQGSKYLDQSGAKVFAVAAGAANVYTATLTPAITAYTTGQLFFIKITTTNTAAATLNLNGLGAKALVKDVTTPLVGGDLLVNKVYAVYYDGTNFQLLNTNSNAYYSNSNLTAQTAPGSTGGTDANTFLSGHISSYWGTAWLANNWTNSYGGLIAFKGSSTQGMQIQYDSGHGTTTRGRLAFRTMHSTGFTTWKQLWSSGDFTATEIANWNTAFTNNHTHTNKSFLDGIDQNLSITSNAVFRNNTALNLIANGLTAEQPGVQFRTDNSLRWFLYRNLDAETGNNAGSSLILKRYADSGADLGIVFSINRSSGIMNYNVAPTVNGNNIWHNGNLANGTVAQYIRGDGSLAALTKAAVGLTVVDNTSDLSKPISTATQTAISAVDAAAVHKTGNETIAGTKLFSNNVGIGILDTKGYKLAVGGSVIAESVKVKLQGAWPDYVFEEGHHLLPLNELEKFIATNKHLPDVPTAEEVKKEGIELGEMNAKLLRKIEELTLYVIDLRKENEKLKDNTTEQIKALSEIIKKLSNDMILLENKQ